MTSAVAAFAGKAALFLVAIWIATAGFVETGSARSTWSETKPALNITHIFDGEINRHGKPVGFHVTPKNPAQTTARIKEILSGPNKAGVYTAIVEIYDSKEEKWKEKFSSIFPDTLSRQQVIEAILTAISKNMLGSGAKWRGPSGRGFLIEGYRSKTGAINTAYPIYVTD